MSTEPLDRVTERLDEIQALLDDIKEAIEEAEDRIAEIRDGAGDVTTWRNLGYFLDEVDNLGLTLNMIEPPGGTWQDPVVPSVPATEGRVTL